jgi:hypothetical protein
MYAKASTRRSERVIATQTQSQRRSAAKKAAATRKRNAARRSQRQTAASARRTTRQARTAATSRAQAESTQLAVFADQAERALTLPVGAALAARDSIVRAARPWTSRQRAQRQLRKLERRGATALRRSQRRVERQARTTRRGVERTADGVASDTGNLIKRVASIS